MADTESILQLGIEAARAGDKEEARDLFRLLTREKPDDSQAWLWLAGVSDERVEKQAALEQVLRLDPSNDLARKSMEAMGLQAVAATAAPAAPAVPEPDFLSDPFAVPSQEAAPSWSLEPEAPASDPFAFSETSSTSSKPGTPADAGRTRELTADEEWAMSLDSLGSMTSAYTEKEKAAGGSDAGFDIPDFGFGDEDSVDVAAYMNRERVDPSTIEVTADEAKKPVRKPIVSGLPGKSERKKREKDNAARSRGSREGGTGRAAGGGRMLLLVGLAALLVAVLLFLFLNRKSDNLVANNLTTTPSLAGTVLPPGGGVITGTQTIIPTIDPNVLPTTDPNVLPTIDPNVQPTPPPFNPPADPSLGGVQPTLLTPDGFQTVTVARDGETAWFFTFGGATAIGDGNAMGIQPQGRWVEATLLMWDGEGSGRTIPGDLVVLKDGQGRVYTANPQASAAFRTTYGVGDVDLTQPAPAGFNFLVPLVFDVAPDATDLVLFSPLDPSVGFYVRANTY